MELRIKTCTTVILVLLYSSITLGSLLFHLEGSSASLECSGPGDVQYWLLNGKGVAINTISQDGIYMHENGSLFFEEVKKEHRGHHLCVTNTQNVVEAFNIEMNVRYLPPVNLWEARYKKMFLTGIIAAIICLLLFVGIYLVDKYRWKDPDPRQKDHLVDESYINQAMEVDGNTAVRM